MVAYDHPGALGLTSRGVVAIHVDWSACPAEHGWDVAIVMLARLDDPR